MNYPIFEAPNSSLEEKEIHELCEGQQSESIAQKILDDAKALLMPHERIQHLVIQNRWSLKVFPSALILTQRRMMMMEQGWFKMTFLDLNWRFLKNVHISESILGAKIDFKTTDDEILSISCLPKGLARKAYSFSQNIEEPASLFRRKFWIEEQQAQNKANIATYQTTPPPYQANETYPARIVAETPVAAPLPVPPPPQRITTKVVSEKIDMQIEMLEKLKGMNDDGLIELEEYRNKRKKLLNGLMEFEDPLESMRRFKILLDRNIITDFEYSEYKEDILNNF